MAFDDNVIMGGFVEVASTVGTYKMVSKVVEVAILKIQLVKNLVFGSSYMEGKWVGCYIGSDDKPVYFIEAYEQYFDSLIIRGEAYFSNGAYKGNWVSENVNIDVVKGEITYTYTTNFINNTHKNQGLAVFNFTRENGKKPPNMLKGFSSDIFSNEKARSLEKKIDTKNMTYIDLIEEAKTLYNENQYYFK